MKFDEFPDSHDNATKSRTGLKKKKKKLLFGLSVPEIDLTHEKYNNKMKRRKLKFSKIINRWNKENCQKKKMKKER